MPVAGLYNMHATGTRNFHNRQHFIAVRVTSYQNVSAALAATVRSFPLTFDAGLPENTLNRIAFRTEDNYKIQTCIKKLKERRIFC